MPSAERNVAARRRDAAAAGHRGDERTARRLLFDSDADVRGVALAALARMGRLRTEDLGAGLTDASPTVRRRAAEAAATLRGAEPPLAPLLDDPDASVAEMAAWAIGERRPIEHGAVEALSRMATSHDDALCREAAVAALGAIGDEAGLPAILAATSDRPAVRRRAVIALAPFEGPEVDTALRRAADDRDWQTRQAAEDLLGERPRPRRE